MTRDKLLLKSCSSVGSVYFSSKSKNPAASPDDPVSDLSAAFLFRMPRPDGSQKIPRSLVGALTKTCVTAPINFPFCTMGEPDPGNAAV